MDHVVWNKRYWLIDICFNHLSFYCISLEDLHLIIYASAPNHWTLGFSNWQYVLLRFNRHLSMTRPKLTYYMQRELLQASNWIKPKTNVSTVENDVMWRWYVERRDTTWLVPPWRVRDNRLFDPQVFDARHMFLVCQLRLKRARYVTRYCIFVRWTGHRNVDVANSHKWLTVHWSFLKEYRPRRAACWRRGQFSETMNCVAFMADDRFLKRTLMSTKHHSPSTPRWGLWCTGGPRDNVIIAPVETAAPINLSLFIHCRCPRSN